MRGVQKVPPYPYLVPAARSLSHEVVAQGSSATLLRCGDDG